MSAEEIVPILMLITLGAVVAFAWTSKAKTEARLKSPDATKSTLAADKNSHGKPADV